MDKMNWLSGILTVGSMVMAGVAIRKAKQHQSCEDYAWKCHNEVMYDLDIARKDLEKSYSQADKLIETCDGWIELYEDQKQTIQNLQQACDKWADLCGKQRETIRELREERIDELIKNNNFMN